MNVSECIINGIKSGVSRHWSYTKNSYHIKPEYLLTVSVADALMDGFDGIDGLDLEIKLEEPTGKISRDLLINAVGFKRYLKEQIHNVSRKGKVDIYVKHNRRSFVVELKGFDPRKTEIIKEIDRLLQFLLVKDGNNECQGCYLAFPTSKDKKALINKNLTKAKGFIKFQVTFDSERVETDEDPEDGISIYYANCISITPRLKKK